MRIGNPKGHPSWSVKSRATLRAPLHKSVEIAIIGGGLDLFLGVVDGALSAFHTPRKQIRSKNPNNHSAV